MARNKRDRDEFHRGDRPRWWVMDARARHDPSRATLLECGRSLKEMRRVRDSRMYGEDCVLVDAETGTAVED